MEQICTKYMTEDRKKREGDIGERVSKYLGNETDKKIINVHEATNNIDRGARETTFIRSKLASAKSPVDVIICGSLLCLVGASALVDDEGLSSQLKSTARMLLGKL
jgi:hypothetical protein